MDLTKLPSTFYRVAIKCLIFNASGELLVVKNTAGEIEIPGGGWEHGETLTECVQRELQEEIGATAKTIGAIKAVLPGVSDRGWHVLRVAVETELVSNDFTFNDPEVVEAFYVSRDEFLTLKFCPADSPFASASNQIWANS
jgi:8-oxo-dGTP pyrophosphatase MutT (NUDIX family)